MIPFGKRGGNQLTEIDKIHDSHITSESSNNSVNEYVACLSILEHGD